MCQEQCAREPEVWPTDDPSDFVAAAHHLLRTPLTSVVGYAELLADGVAGPLLPAQQEMLAKVEDNCAELLALLDELFRTGGRLLLEPPAPSGRGLAEVTPLR